MNRAEIGPNPEAATSWLSSEIKQIVPEATITQKNEITTIRIGENGDNQIILEMDNRSGEITLSKSGHATFERQTTNPAEALDWIKNISPDKESKTE